MPGGIWGLLSPRLTLWAGVSELRLYALSGEVAVVDVGRSYGRGEIIEPRRLSNALVAAYREHSHRSYGVAPFVRAFVPPGTSPAGLFLWDAVLRTSGASDWSLEDGGLLYIKALERPLLKELRMEALLFIFKTCTAWEVVRLSGEASEVVLSDNIPFGAGDGIPHETLSSMLERSMKGAVSEMVSGMVEDEVALLAGAPVTVFVEDAGSENEHVHPLAKTVQTVLGGGGGMTVEHLPLPDALFV